MTPKQAAKTQRKLLLRVLQLFVAHGKRDGIGWLGLRVEGRRLSGQFRGLKDDRLFSFTWSDSRLTFWPTRAAQDFELSLDLPQATKTRLRGSQGVVRRYSREDTYLCGDRQIPSSQACYIRQPKLGQAQPQIRRQCPQGVNHGGK